MKTAPVLPRGVDHLVFNTDDRAATIEFYCEVLGMRLVHVARTPRIADQVGAGEPPVPYLRHYFFDMGNDSTIAFFEYPKGTAKGDRDALGNGCVYKNDSPHRAGALTCTPDGGQFGTRRFCSAKSYGATNGAASALK